MNRSDMSLTQRIREDGKKRAKSGTPVTSLDALISDTRKAIRTAYSKKETKPRKQA